MRSIVAWLAASALVSPAAAFAFDSANCRSFLVGTWEGSAETTLGEKRMKTVDRTTYHDDGTYVLNQTIQIGEAEPSNQSSSGTWDAEPGKKPSMCRITWDTPETGKSALEWTVKDENTISFYGAELKRVS